MGKGKLILICQCGGEFVKNDDGSLKYNGGEAQAVNIDSETLFDDLKLKLAEVCNLDFKTVVVKYFLPGNTRTLINLSNDKELKRMLDFHGKSVTAEVFVTGTVGFDRDVLNLGTRETSVKVAESANRVAVPTSASPVVSPPARAVSAKNPVRKKVVSGRKKATTNQKTPAATHKKATPAARAAKSKMPVHRKRKHVDTESDIGVEATSNSPTGGTTASNASDDSDSDFSDFPLRSLVAAASKVKAITPIEVDMSASPADAVKKRRRIASSKLGDNSTAIATVAKGGISARPRKRKSKRFVADEELQLLGEGDSDEDDFNVSLADDGPLEKLVASWRKGIRHVGQDFSDAAEFRDVLQKYALACRFVYKLKKNEATRISARCAIESCSWKLLACWVPDDNAFRIKTFNKSHSCGGESWKSAHPNRRIFVNYIRERLRNSPHQKVKDIANSLSRNFGFELNLSQVRRGVNDAREQLQGSYQEAYNQLTFYCDQIAQANPMSIIKIETNEEKRFQRLFISFNASIHGFESGCRPLLFLEASSMKSKCKEKLFTATALDGNDGLFPVAFAIVDNEDNDTWHWFLEMLRSALPTTSGSLTFVSDREKGLKEVVLGVFKDAHIGYSIYHLLQRFMRSVKRPFQGHGRSFLPGYFIGAAQAIQFSVFKSFVEKIMKVSPEAYDWLMQVEPEYWATTSFKGEPYNHITQNVAESYIKLMVENRESTITHKLQALIYMMSELINSRREEPNSWSSKLTPPKQEKLREEFAEARGLKVLFSSDTVFEVRDDVSHVVNLNIADCTCLVWRRTGIPCRHAIAVFNCTCRNAYDFCSRYYTTDSYLLMYSKSINPVDRPAEIEESDADAVLMLPPRPPRAWLSQPRKRQTKKLGTEGIDSCNEGNEDGQTEALSVADPEVVGEGNLIAAFDANGQVRDRLEFDDAANGEALLEDSHEVAIEVDPGASLDAVVEVACEVVSHEVGTEADRIATIDDTSQVSAEGDHISHEVTTETDHVATIDDIGQVSAEGERITLIDANNEASLDNNGVDKSEADYDLFGEASHEVSLELFGEPNSVASHDVNVEASHEANDEAAHKITGEASHEVDTIASIEVTGEASLEADSNPLV